MNNSRNPLTLFSECLDWTLFVLAMALAALVLFAGCDVNTKVRPFFWPKEKPPEQVQPATPPKPAPPPDDWAPPFFHRPKPNK